MTTQLLLRQLRWALHYSPRATAAIAELMKRQNGGLAPS